MKSKHLLHLLMMALLVPGIVNAQNLPANGPKTESWQDLTINSNVSNYVSYYVPFSGRSVDQATSSQFIIPATSLVDMVGNTGSKVRKLTFYSKDATKDWGTAQFKVFMAEVPNDQFIKNEYIAWESLTQVYEGSVSLSNYQMTITFSEQFTYTGENLLVGFDLSQTGTGDATRWLYAVTDKNSALFSVGENPQSVVVEENTTSYLPKMTFNYQTLPYQRVYPVVPVVNGTTVNLSWGAPNNQVTGYAYQFKKSSDAWSEEWTETQNTSVEITDLVLGEEYDFRVKALYGSNESVPTRVTFIADCAVTPMLLNEAYTENFDSYTVSSMLTPNEHVMPRCWESVNACADPTSPNRVFPTISYYLTKFEGNTTPFAYSPSNSLMFHFDKNQNDPQPQYAIMPPMQHIQLMQVTCQAVKTKLMPGDWNSWSGTFKIGVMEEDGTFTEVKSFTLSNYGSGNGASYPTTENYETCTADFSNYTGTGNRIAFMMDVPASTTIRYGRIYIDDISVDYTVPMPSTFIKEIDPWVDGTGTVEPGGWFLISSPLYGDTDPANVQNMLNNTNPEDFDLYRFEQNTIYFDELEHGLEWENWKAIEPHYSIEPLRGYLYANRAGDDLVFTGVPYYGDGKVTLKKVETLQDGGAVEFPGWNLIGNPWGNNYASITRSYYRINDAGNEVIAGTGNVAPMEAVFVIAENNDDIETFTKIPSNQTTGMTMALNLSSANDKVIDRTVLRFDEGSTLPKFQLNPNHTKVYIPQNGKDYAVVNAEGQGEMPINFRAAENGNYTLSFSKDNVEFSYLHLIDNMTSADIDLLSTPSYTFKAKTSDYESRFKLVYASNSKIEGDESFGFINESGNFSVYGIEGEATLQMIDMTGRVISTDTFNGSIEKKIDITNGIYMFRLINGDNVKVQKVVVK